MLAYASPTWSLNNTDQFSIQRWESVVKNWKKGVTNK